MVRPGQSAYRVIPTSTSSSRSGEVAGQATLDQDPVVPGSAESQALVGAGAGAGSGSSTSQNSSSGSAAGQNGPLQGSQGSHPGASTPSFWNRVASTLEFWR